MSDRSLQESCRSRLGLVQLGILRFIQRHDAEAYGGGIAEGISRLTGDDVSDAQIYVALRRLEVRGLITAADPTGEHNPPSKGRRGRPRKFYSLTESGRRALLDADGLMASDHSPDRSSRAGGSLNGWETSPASVVG